jgi:hypothetical protein
LSSGVHDLYAYAAIAFQQLEQLPGDGPLQAAADLADALALAASPRGTGTGLRIVAQPGQHNRVQGPVELAVAAAAQPMPDDLP